MIRHDIYHWGNVPADLEYKGRFVHNWFSNFEPSLIEIDGHVWPSVENYYQGSKCLVKSDMLKFINMTPSKSKHQGRRVKIRGDWEEIKIDVMRTALQVKFDQPEWRDKLLATGGDVIVEWNNWGDRIWGATLNGVGKNYLGQLLMEIRDGL